MPLEEENQVEAKSGVGLEVVFPIICTTVAICAIVALKYFLKNLNETVRNILLVANVHMALVSLVTSLILFFWNDEESRSEKCGTIQVLMWTNGLIATGTLAITSFAKFYLAIKTAKLKAINLNIIVFYTILIYFLGYLLAILVTVFEKTRFMADCTGQESSNMIGALIAGIYTVTLVSIGFFYDISLYFFLKKRQEKEKREKQVDMIPWKTSNEDEEYQFMIPIGASITALSSALVICITLIGFSIADHLLEAYYIILAILFVLPSVIMIVMVGLTMGTAFNHKPKPQIPKRLCFHDQNDEADEDEENQGENVDHNGTEDLNQAQGNEVNDHAIEVPEENQSDNQERDENQDLNQDGPLSPVQIQKKLKMEKKLWFHDYHDCPYDETSTEQNDEENQMSKIKKIFVQPFEQNPNESNDNATSNEEVKHCSEQDNLDKKRGWKVAESGAGYENQSFELEEINNQEALSGGSVNEKLDESFNRPKDGQKDHFTSVQQEKRKGKNPYKVDSAVYHGRFDKINEKLTNIE